MKRSLDICCAALGLVISSPVLLIFMALVWAQDHHSPFYVAPRIGKGGKPFRMVKLRSMIVNADRSGVDSTSVTDSRITRVGALIRKYKLDELTQLWNVLKGDMSLVGPRPNVERDTRLYTEEEQRLLSVKPGITDLASIVFSDEGEILAGKQNPDLAYNQLIRPWKSRLGLFYIDNRTLLLDIRVIYYTAVGIVSKGRALQGVQKLLRLAGATVDLMEAASRRTALRPSPPPGASEIVRSR